MSSNSPPHEPNEISASQKEEKNNRLKFIIQIDNNNRFKPGEKVTVFLLFSCLSSAGLKMGISPSVEFDTVSSTKGQL